MRLRRGHRRNLDQIEPQSLRGRALEKVELALAPVAHLRIRELLPVAQVAPAHLGRRRNEGRRRPAERRKAVADVRLIGEPGPQKRPKIIAIALLVGSRPRYRSALRELVPGMLQGELLRRCIGLVGPGARTEQRETGREQDGQSEFEQAHETSRGKAIFG